MTFSCWKCGGKIEYPTGSRVGLRDTCSKCDADLHACRNCLHYDPGKHNQCAETQAEWVRYKEEANHCDYFSPNPVLLARNGAPSKGDEAKRKFGSLFKL